MSIQRWYIISYYFYLLEEWEIKELEKLLPVTFCNVLIGRLGVTVVAEDWLPTTAGTFVDNGFAKRILFAELDITGPGSEALGVNPDAMPLPTGRAAASLFVILSAIIGRWIWYRMRYTFKCQENFPDQYRNTLFKNTELLQ